MVCKISINFKVLCEAVKEKMAIHRKNVIGGLSNLSLGNLHLNPAGENRSMPKNRAFEEQ
jgi:hypothetical protein